MKSKITMNQANKDETLSKARRIKNFFEGKCCIDFSFTENLKELPSNVSRVPVLPPRIPTSKSFNYSNESTTPSSSYTKQLVSKIDKKEKENKRRFSLVKKKETKSRKSFSKSFSSKKGFSRFH